LGFSDHSYFIRLFHRITGITPQEYRKRFLQP
jgi:AraC-like DNA-binding protein